MKDMADLDPSVSLLTILNVASARPTKRARPSQRDWHAIAKKIHKSDKVTDKGKSKASNGLIEVAEGTLDELEEAVELDGSDLGAFGSRLLRFAHSPQLRAKVGPGRRSKGQADVCMAVLVADDDREDSYEHHWAPTPKIFGGKTGQELSQLNWTKSSAIIPALGKVTEAKPEGVQATSQDKASIVSVLPSFRGREEASVC